MLQDLQKQGERHLSVISEPMRQWAGSVVLAIAVAIAYFLASRLSFFLRTQPDDIAWFWPAAGVAGGALIALGPGTRWPVAVGTITASIPGNLLGNWSLSTSIIFALCNAGQVLLIAGLIERYFGSPFSLDSLRQVLGLVAAAIVGTAAAAIGGTVGAVRRFDGPTPDRLVSLADFQRTRHRRRRAAVDRARFRCARSAAAQRNHRMRCRACGASRTERTYYFLAAGAFGRRGGCRPTVPIAAMACRPLQAGLRGGRRVHHCPFNRLDDDIQHWHVR
jgi:hypothetical protein